MAVNVACLVSVIILYILILVIGILAARKTRKSSNSEEIMVANRSLGFIVACFSLTATLVGGGFINGTSEYVARYGILQTQAPVCYSLGMFIGGLFYAGKMRRESYVTLFDPFQLKYGKKMGALLIIPHVFGDIFWSGSILAALGATVAIIIDINSTVAIIGSAFVAIVYTVFGGLFAVAYTDIIQLGLIAVGLILACPFAMTNEHVHLENIWDTWQGEVKSGTEWAYADTMALLILGGIPWQPYYQRCLACKTPRIASVSTMIAAFFSVLLAIPAAVLGVAGGAADWNSTSYDGPIPLQDKQLAQILPLALDNLVPLPVSIIGIGAIAAAVMSSADSCFLSAATVFTNNVYREIVRRKATDREQMWVLRIMVIFFGTLGTLIAIFSTTIYGLFVLCGDLMYVVLFPQLTCVLWLPWANTYGSFAGFVVSFLLRILSGDKVLGLPAVIRFPLYDDATSTQLFPYRTLAMLSGLACIVVISGLAHVLFLRGIVPVKYDIFKCHRQRTTKRRGDFTLELKENNGKPLMVDGETVDSSATGKLLDESNRVVT